MLARMAFRRAVPRASRMMLMPRVPLYRQSGLRFQSQLPKQELMLAFTCKKCSTRSSHTISKQAYTGGTVLVKCPGCNNRHLIADHLKIFKDNKFTVEDLMSVSKSTDDLVFEEIPEKLRGVLGYYAKDAPAEYTEEESNEVKKLK